MWIVIWVVLFAYCIVVGVVVADAEDAGEHKNSR